MPLKCSDKPIRISEVFSKAKAFHKKIFHCESNILVHISMKSVICGSKTHQTFLGL